MSYLIIVIVNLMCSFSMVKLENWNRLGFSKEDLPKIEEELELEIAKSELTELKKDCIEAMETQLKRCAP